MFDARAWATVDAATFRETTWDAQDQNVDRATPLDHCPKSVELRF
jgi:hypothetical protein